MNRTDYNRRTLVLETKLTRDLAQHAGCGVARELLAQLGAVKTQGERIELLVEALHYSSKLRHPERVARGLASGLIVHLEASLGLKK